jgi:phosphate:Na+ symporter
MILTVGALLGGIGLFLLGMSFLTDGLKVLAGSGLKVWLARATTSRLRAISTGVLATALIQSSSATTIMAIGFVNAGLIGLTETIGLIYGANVGTTLTGWIIALVGVKVKTTFFALPLVGLGAAMKLFGKEKWAAIGGALAGFGLLFHGIDLLQASMSDTGEFGLGRLSSTSLLGRIGLVAIGMVMTVVMQSSSAALAVTLAAVSTGTIAIPEAAALAIGQNVGTTFTAVLAVLGKSQVNARRAAAAHVLFNVGTGALALVVFVPFLRLVEWLADVTDVRDAPSLLALFHTTFNVLGVVVLAPLIPLTVRVLLRVLPDRGDVFGVPRFLDRSVLSMPDAALAAVDLELENMKSQVVKIVALAVTRDGYATHSGTVREASTLHDGILRVGDAVAAYLEEVARGPSTSPRIFALVHVLTHLVSVTQEAYASIVERQDKTVKRVPVVADVEEALLAVLDVLRRPLTDLSSRRDEIARLREESEKRRSTTRDAIFAAVTTGELTPHGALALADYVNDLSRLTYGLARAAHVWAESSLANAVVTPSDAARSAALPLAPIERSATEKSSTTATM